MQFNAYIYFFDFFKTHIIPKHRLLNSNLLLQVNIMEYHRLFRVSWRNNKYVDFLFKNAFKV